jgi:RNA polymerase sigma factor (sigma-70 family)
MSHGTPVAVLRGLDGLFGLGTTTGLAEGRLLERFVARRDETAFEAIVARHGPMVWGVCRRTLRDQNDAEDAFQATFLILARRAGAIRQRDRLGGWLHGVAHRVATRARRDASRRASSTLPADLAGMDQPQDADYHERIALLHEEINRLPGKYRDPIVLCHLEGCTHDEAAARLGWSVGTVRGRLARGRDRLRDRLTRRGLERADVAGLAAATGAAPGASLVVPGWLAESTIKAAIRFAVEHQAALVLNAQGAAWVERGLRAMILKQAKLVVLLIVTTVVVSAGVGALAFAQERRSKAEAPRHKVTGQTVDLDGLPDIELVSSDVAAERRERIAAEIADGEANLDLLQMDVDQEKERIASAYQKIIALEDQLEQMEMNPPEFVGATEEQITSFKKQHDVRKHGLAKRIEMYREKIQAAREKYLRDRISLGREQRRIQLRQQQLGRRPPEDALPPALERRLGRIEGALESLRAAVGRNAEKKREQ